MNLVKVLLVDDQAIVGESIRRMLAGEADVALHFCQDPAHSIRIANELQPTVILQDLVMPDIDGLQLVRFFRANPATRDVPMIVLSSKEEPAIKAQAFALGANDYLVKLPDRLELLARVRYHSRAYVSQLERDEAFRQLAESQRLLAAEVAQAARYVQSLLPDKLHGEPRIDWRFVPSTQLGGDMFGYHRLDADHTAIYLLDVSGHGVGSSLLAVSASNLLAARSLPDTDFRDPGQVLTNLNEVFQMDRQDGKYFTIWYGVYHAPSRRLAFSSAGHPAGLLFSAAPGGQPDLQRLEVDGPAIGVFETYTFENREIVIGPPARLMIFSDGVFEIEQADGRMWTFGKFVDFVSRLQAEGGAVADRLLSHVQQLHGSKMLNDDFSILEIDFG